MRLPERLLSASDVASSLDLRLEAARRRHAVDEPPLERLGGAEPAAEQHQLLGPSRSDQTRETLAAAPAGDEAEIGVLIAEPSGLIGHHQIDDQRQLEAAGEGEAVDAGDDGDGQRFEAIEHAVPEAHELVPLHGIRRQLAHGA